jgi:hypothetical protein
LREKQGKAGNFVVEARRNRPYSEMPGYHAIRRYRLENDPRFLRRIEQARASARAGLGVRLEDIEE